MSFDNNGLDLNLGTSDFHNNVSNQQNESHFEKPECSFAFGDYHEYEDEKNEFDDVLDDNPLPNYQSWQKYMSFKPDIPETPIYKSKPMISKDYKKETDVKVGQIFDNKEALDLAIRLKGLNEGYQFLNERSAPERKISRRFTTLYYTLPPNNTLSGLKQIKNDYDTNVMYDIAKVAGKIQLFVSHHQIYLSTVLIPNDGSLEEAFAAHYKLQIYIDDLGVDFIIVKYIFPNASLAEMMNHVISNYTSDSEDNKREVTQNDYTFNQMVEWAEQEHFEDEEIKLSCPKIDLITFMADSANDARKTIVGNLQRELEAEVTLANTMLGNLTRYFEQMRIREIQITMLQNMPTMSLNSYGLHALLMTHEADIHTTNNLIRARQELLRSIAEKQNFINNYRAI
ncbi:hypothetical protein Tco_0621493 [Tanacetum coccineum]